MSRELLLETMQRAEEQFVLDAAKPGQDPMNRQIAIYRRDIMPTVMKAFAGEPMNCAACAAVLIEGLGLVLGMATEVGRNIALNDLHKKIAMVDAARKEDIANFAQQVLHR